MTEISLKTVLPLVAEQRLEGEVLVVEFRCPETGVRIPARHHLRPQPEAGLGHHMRRSLLHEVRWVIVRLLQGIFGHGMLGRVVGDFVGHAAESALHEVGRRPSDEQVQAGLLEAFHQVSTRFAWDARGGRFVAVQALAEVLDPFDAQLSAAPITETWDLAVLARMLVELATHDGRVGPAEEAVLVEFLDASAGSFADLAARPPLSRAELDEVSPGPVRETLVTIAWALALCDEQLGEGERQRLAALAAGLGLHPRQAEAARITGGAFVLTHALDRLQRFGGLDAAARQTLHELAGRIGLSTDDADRVEARFRKRRGLA